MDIPESCGDAPGEPGELADGTARLFPAGLEVPWQLGEALGRAADKPEGLLPSRLEKEADGSLMKISKGNFRALHLGRNNPKHQYELEATQV